MRRFRLIRLEDPSGISGLGQVAEGVEFSDRTCILRWTTANRSTSIYADLRSLMEIHGHRGMTVVDWIDT